MEPDQRISVPGPLLLKKATKCRIQNSTKVRKEVKENNTQTWRKRE